MQSNTKAALFYISTETCAFLPLEIHGVHGIPLAPPTYQSLPEAPETPTERIETESPKISFEKIKEALSPEASYLMEARTIRSSNAKLRMEWARKIEKEVAPQILQQLGFTNIRLGNGRPIDVEALYRGIRYLIDVKYIAQMPSIIRKLASLVVSYPAPEVAVQRLRRRKVKQAN